MDVILDVLMAQIYYSHHYNKKMAHERAQELSEKKGGGLILDFNLFPGAI